MTQTSNRFYDQFARLMNDAAGVAQGVRREATTLFRSQAERFVNDMDLVRREDYEAVKEMASIAREENARLHARIDALESQLRQAGVLKETHPAVVPAQEANQKRSPRSRGARSGASSGSGTA